MFSQTRCRCALVLTLAAFSALGIAQSATADGSTLSCWTRGAYLDIDSFGHKAVCNGPHAVVVTLKRDGVTLTSYTSTQFVLTSAGNYVSTSSRAFSAQCGHRYQTVVKVYPAPMAIPYADAEPTQYWTSGTPRILCSAVASSVGPVAPGE